MVWTQESHHNSVNCDRLGECSPEKDCLRWRWLTFRQIQRKSSSESSELWIVSRCYKSLVVVLIGWRSRDVIGRLSVKPWCYWQVVETSVNVTSNSPSQDYTQPDDHNLPNYEISHWSSENEKCYNSPGIFAVAHVHRKINEEGYHIIFSFWVEAILNCVSFSNCFQTPI